MKFVTQHQAALQQRVSGFFSVNLTARKADKCTPETNAYTRKFLAQSPWQPDRCAVFAGALLLSTLSLVRSHHDSVHYAYDRRRNGYIEGS